MAPTDTQLSIIRSAEQLFAEKGVDGVTLREINIAAGKGDPSKTEHHFTSKIEVVDAILHRHSLPIQQKWVDTLDANDALSLRELMEVMATPVVEKLDDDDGGHNYILICSQLCMHQTWPLIYRPIAGGEGAMRISGELMSRVDLPAELISLRMRRSANVLYQSIADYHQMGQIVARPIFTADLVDALVGLITVVSDETRTVISPHGR